MNFEMFRSNSFRYGIDERFIDVRSDSTQRHKRKIQKMMNKQDPRMAPRRLSWHATCTPPYGFNLIRALPRGLGGVVNQLELAMNDQRRELLDRVSS